MVQLQNITKSFGENKVLKDITLTISKGEIFGLIGKNGAGKTTLLSIIAGLSNATEGSCYINNGLINKSTRSSKVGYLPDVPAFFDFMSVSEFLDFLYKKNADYKQKRDELLKLVGLEGKTIIKTMSRGMRQRLGMAATLVNDPDVILLDEPSSALDPMGRYELSEILLHLKKQGKTIILSTHILTDMENICDRVGFLHDGIIIKTVSPKSMDGSQKVKIVFKNIIKKEMFEGLSLNVTFEGDNCVVLSGNLQDLEQQKDLIDRVLSIENPITYINTLGVDLDSIFREVCL